MNGLFPISLTTVSAHTTNNSFLNSPANLNVFVWHKMATGSADGLAP